jgi:cellobiose phosphorylase
MRNATFFFIVFAFSSVNFCLANDDSPWYRFSDDGTVCHVYKRDLPTPWFNRLSNGYLTAWVTHRGGIDVFMSDPAINTLVNPQEISGNFFISPEGTDQITWINNPEKEETWECQVGLGYSRIICIKDGVRSEVTYFIPLDDNVMLMQVHLTNLSTSVQNINLFGQVEWNLGDRTKYILYRGDGRAGSQHNLYKKAWFSDNTIWATQPNWLNTGDCNAWPFTGFFSADAPVASYETIRRKFLGSALDIAKPAEVIEGKLSNTDFWSEDDYPWGVLHTKLSMEPNGESSVTFILGMERETALAREIIRKYSDRSAVEKAWVDMGAYYSNLISNTVVAETPDTANNIINNIWTKYHWNQVTVKSQNDPDVVGVGLWNYGIEGGNAGVMPEHIMLPFDTSIAEKEIMYLLNNQTSDLSRTSLYTTQPAMKYEDIGREPRQQFPGNSFVVPHHHNLYVFLTSVLFYLKEHGDAEFLNRQVKFFEEYSGTVWEHIDRGLTISLTGLSVHGLPRIPANVGDWMDEFTKISQYGQAESVMLGMQLCFYLNEYAKIARVAGEDELAEKWEKNYAFIKQAINATSWDGDWYIRAFSDRDGGHTPIGTHKEKEGKIYLNAQSWAVMSEVAPPERAGMALESVRSMLLCDFGPKIFSPSYTAYNKYIGTQSIYAPGFRNGNIYMRPAGWAIIAASMAGKNELAWDLYNSASLANQAKNIGVYQCEPYVYPENYVGPDHRMAGKGQFQWCLGEATSWMWVAYNYYLLGIRPEFEGLVIDPRMPEDWDHYEVERPFRGDHYTISVSKNKGLKPGELKIRLDGKSIDGKVISPLRDGKKHTVNVDVGPSLK